MITFTNNDQTTYSFLEENWTNVLQFDEEKDVNFFYNLKKVDFLGVLNQEKIVLIEVKNFKGRQEDRAANILEKLLPDENFVLDKKTPPVIIDVIEKTKQSLLFLSLYSKRLEAATKANEWEIYHKLLNEEKYPIALWFCLELEETYSSIDAQRLKHKMANNLQLLKKRLERLTIASFIISQNHNPMEHIFKIHQNK